MNVITKYIIALKNLSQQYQAEALHSIAAVMLLALATICILDRYATYDTAIITKNKITIAYIQNLLLEKVPLPHKKRKKAGRPCALFFAY